ncbi:UNVERIFIED_CONTAM: putative inactive histone-lysine N-methyltransferase SUVR2 [Sesamum calycinum]|uniref:Inactive histone-lysine N-methyltransferase SUVR2 n=1 Tax=Sesamum calycinum TaxID=2727403 RepID=A0AAW2RUV8_9LAMI
MNKKETKTRVANAFRAMKAIGISEDKVKPVLKSLLILYDKNWALIEEENYRALADAIFERDELEVKGETIEAAQATESLTRKKVTPIRMSQNPFKYTWKHPASMPRTVNYLNPISQRDNRGTRALPKFHPERKEPVPDSSLHALRLKEPKVEPGIILSPKKRSNASQAILKPKDEPVTEDMACLEVSGAITHPDVSNGADASSGHGMLTENCSPEPPSALQSVTEKETAHGTGTLNKPRNNGELAVISVECSSNLEIASSPSGEVKISLSYNLGPGRPDFRMPSLEAVLKSVEDKCLRSPKTLDLNVSVMTLMTEMCQCFLKLGTGSNSQSTETMDVTPTIASVSKSSAADALGASGLHFSSLNGLVDSQSGAEVPQPKTPVIPPPSDGVNDGPHLNKIDVGNEILTNRENKENCAEEWNGLSLEVVHQPQVAPEIIRSLHDVVDIAKGQEKVVITLVNDVNDECPPSFNYIPKNAAFQNAYVNFSLARIGDNNCCANCSGDCLSLSTPCACANETGGEFAYTTDGLVREELLKECISMNRDPKKHCQFFCKECPLERSKCEDIIEPCKGHLVRKFIKNVGGNVAVYMTPEGKGWGLRTLEDLPKGAFVCEYVGEVLTNAELFERVLRSPKGEKHSYPVLLDADWCAEGVLKDEEALCLDATYYGNVARFINHRCYDSNLVEIPVEVETPDHHFYHLAFFTTRKVKAMEELTWDYGIDFDDHEHPIKAFRCQCGSKYCRNIKRSTPPHSSLPSGGEKESGGEYPAKMSKRGRGGSAGNKFRMSLGLPVAATVNCADNTGAKNLYIISVKGIKGRLNRLPSACVGDMVMATVKKGKPDLRKKVMPAVIVRQRKPWRRKDGVYMYFEDNAGVIVNPKGEMKGSAITGPIGKECADLWPRIASAANAIV